MKPDVNRLEVEIVNVWNNQKMKSRHRSLVGTTVRVLLAAAALGHSAAAGERKANLPPNYGQIQPAKFGDLRGGFAQPDMIYAPFAFWFWDEPLDAGKYPAKARDMARKMMEQGMNPGYTHPRLSAAEIFGPGAMKPSPSLPKDQWLSKEWFDSFDAALKSAEAGKGYLGYNDEYMWPVGRAAGRVLKQHPELTNASLQWKVVDVVGGQPVSLSPSFFTVAVQLTDASVKAAAPKPLQGQWIWQPTAGDTARVFYFRKTFDMSAAAKPLKATLRITVDNSYKLFVNGSPVGQENDWTKVGNYDVTALLRSGRNVIAVEGGGDGNGFDALLCALEIDLGGGRRMGVVSDGGWVVSKNATEGWNTTGFKDTEWKKVRVVGPAGMAPWNLAETKFTVTGPLADVPKAMQGQWIWKSDAADTARQFYLRKAFDLSAGQTVTKAVLRIAVDNTYKLFINGAAVGAGDDWTKVGTYDVAALLRPGRNVIAVEGGGDGGLDALLCDLETDLDDGQHVSVLSDGDWVISKNADAGWPQPEFKDAEWKKVRVLGPADMPPWNLAETKVTYQKATVRSATLRLIGSGEAFSWTAPAGGNWRVYTFNMVLGADVNVLDRRLAKAFIAIAHQPYADRLGARFGKSMPGVFCDTEGGYGNGNGIPWSDDLARRYQTNTSRDLRLWTPLLFDDDAEGVSARARTDWFNAMSDLYSGFHAEVSDWLEQRGVYYIANLWEESLQWQTTFVGDHMKNQRGFSMPGTDCLQLKAYDAHDFKEAQAVAEFEGRRLMSEIMGAGGWDAFSPITIKECVNSVVAWGVGHVVAHGVFMTRDLDGNGWTPDWYDENPLWSNLHLWTDFTRRASYVNSHGRAVPEVLLLNPIESVWALLGQTDKLWGGSIHGIAALDGLYSPEAQTINKAYGDAMRQLTSRRVEYLVADGHYLSQMKLEGDRLVRGDFRFKAVVMPPMAVMQLAEAKTVVDFAKAGGRVYTLGKLPTGSPENGLHDPAMAALMTELQAQPTVKACVQGFRAELSAKAPGLESCLQFVSGEFPMLQHHRRIDGCDFFWLVNNSKAARQCVVQVAGASGEASVWDCETGKVRPVASTKEGGDSKMQLAFQPHEAYWLVFDPKKPALAAPVMALPAGKVLLQLAATGWQVRVDPAAQPNLQHAVAIPPALTAAAGVERDLTLWKTWSDLPPNFSGLVDYMQTIDLPDFKGELVLDLGTVNHFAEVWVNGKSIGAKLWPPHRFQTAAFRPGKNEIRIRVGNLVNLNYGMASPSGLLGPVTLRKAE